MYVSLVFAPLRAGFLRQHSTAIGGPGCDCEVGAAGRHLRRSPCARAARGDRVSWFYGVLKVQKCSPGAKSHAEIAALVRDEATLPGGLRKQGGSCSGMPRVCRGGSGGRARDAAKKS